MQNHQFPLPIAIAIMAFGVLPLLPAIFNWDWFFELSFFKEEPMGALGRDAQRLLYGIIGVAIMALGIALAFGLISPI